MRQAKLPLAVAVFIVALLYVVNVMAFRGAAVHDAATFTVVSTNAAALALAPGTGNAANQVSIASGIMQIDFRKGFGGAIPFSMNRDRSLPLQMPGGGAASLGVSGDILRMRQVFTVTNISTDCHDVSVYVTSGGPSHLVGIYGRHAADAIPGIQLANANGARIAAANVKLGTTAPSNQMLLDFWWQAGATGFANTGNFTVEVSGTQSAACP